MDKAKFDERYRELTKRHHQVLDYFLQGKEDAEIADSLNMKEPAVRKRLGTIRGIFGKEYDNGATENLTRDELEKLFCQFMPELVCDKILEKHGYGNGDGDGGEGPPPFLESPEGPVPLNSPFYIERVGIDGMCQEIIKIPGSILPIKAPKRMGKTSLIRRLLETGKGYNYHFIYLNLQSVDQSEFGSIDQFLYCLTSYIEQKLPHFDEYISVDRIWQKSKTSNIRCTNYLQQVLERIEIPLILALDEVDIAFNYPQIYQQFLPLLRTWNEEAAINEAWEKLRLIIAYSTEDYGRLNINQSPFNVRESIELREFTPEEIKKLALPHQLNSLTETADFQDLQKLIGGHPYLIRLAFHHLAQGKLALSELLENAPTNAGIYQKHLLEHLVTLRTNSELVAGYRQVVTATEAVTLDPIITYQLDRMGLVKKIGNEVIPRCQLYSQYFSHCL